MVPLHPSVPLPPLHGSRDPSGLRGSWVWTLNCTIPVQVLPLILLPRAGLVPTQAPVLGNGWL